MTGESSPPMLRYFRSFTALDLPVSPMNEVAPEEIDALVSFYTATFDNAGRLQEFRKYINANDAGINRRELVFVDRYQYSSDGKLACRFLTHQDGKESRWYFNNGGDASERALSSAHDQLVNSNARILHDVTQSSLAGRELAYVFGMQLLQNAERIFRDMTRDENLRLISMSIGGDGTWIAMLPFEWDESMPLRVLLAENEETIFTANRPLVFRSPAEMFDKSPELAALTDQLKWPALALMPFTLRAEKLVPAGVICVMGKHEWSAVTASHVKSLLHRIVLDFEFLLELGRRDELSNRATRPSKDETHETP